MLTPSVGGTMKFGQDRNRCSEKKYVTIPNSNCSESSEDSWFVYYYAHVPTKNAKLLTPFWGVGYNYKGTAKLVIGAAIKLCHTANESKHYLVPNYPCFASISSSVLYIQMYTC